LIPFDTLCTVSDNQNIMSTITFNTLDLNRKLRDAGFDETQAEVVVRVMLETQSERVAREHFDAKFDKLQWMMGAMLGIGITILFKLFH
jgi:uncharacterized membrane protein affecting hemolysin expression